VSAIVVCRGAALAAAVIFDAPHRNKTELTFRSPSLGFRRQERKTALPGVKPPSSEDMIKFLEAYFGEHVTGIATHGSE